MTDSVQVVDEVRNTDEWQNAHVNLAHNTSLHGLVVQVWYVCRSNAHVLFDIALVCILDVRGCHSAVCLRSRLDLEVGRRGIWRSVYITLPGDQAPSLMPSILTQHLYIHC